MFALDYTNYISRPDWEVTRYDYTNNERQTQESFYFQYSICKCPDSDVKMHDITFKSDEEVYEYNRSQSELGLPRMIPETV